MIKRLQVFFEMIKVEHTLFALPLAYMGMVIGASGFPSWRIFLWITACMVTLRTAAMSLNRLIDRLIDKQNPRTASRALCQNQISALLVLVISVVCCALFVVCAAQLNRICFYLSPIPLVLIVLYPYMKRWSWLCHYVLGAALACAPIGGWLAVTGEIVAPMYLLFFASFFWVGGFDIIYALQDWEFDQQAGLHSIPSIFGPHQALRLSRLSHGLMLILLLSFVLMMGYGWPLSLGVALTAIFLWREQRLAFTLEKGKIMQAFFHMNVRVSLTLLLATVMEMII